MGTTFYNIQLINKKQYTLDEMRALLEGLSKSIGLKLVLGEGTEVSWQWYMEKGSKNVELYMPLELLEEKELLFYIYEQVKIPVILTAVFDSDLAFVQLCDSKEEEYGRIVYDITGEVADSILGTDNEDRWIPYLSSKYSGEDIKILKQKKYIYAEDMIYDLFTMLEFESKEFKCSDEENMNELRLKM